MSEKEEIFSTPDTQSIPFGLVDSEQLSLAGPRTTRAADAKGSASSTICVSGIPSGVTLSDIEKVLRSDPGFLQVRTLRQMVFADYVDAKAAAAGVAAHQGQQLREGAGGLMLDLDQDKVETEAVAPTQAFEVFAGQVRQHGEFSSTSGGVHTKITANMSDPMDRYFRLKAELDELERDVKILGGEGGAPQTGEEGGAGEETKSATLPRNIRPCEVWQKMAVELDGMKTQLEDLGGRGPLRSLLQGQSPATSSSGELTPALLKVADALVQSSTPAGDGTDAKGSEAAPSATYELYYQANAGALSGGISPGAADAAAVEAARFRSLEQRVAGLESWLGEGRGVGGVGGGASGAADELAADGGVSAEASGFAGGLYGTMRGLTGAGGEGGSVAALPLVDAVAVLEERLARLDRPQVEGCAGALRSLRKELDSFNSDQKKAGGASGILETEQLAALLRRTELIDDFGPDLPALVTRLRTLQALHTQAIHWMNRLTQVEQDQARTDLTIKNDRKTVAQLEMSLRNNMSQLKANIQAVDKRVNELASRVE